MSVVVATVAVRVVVVVTVVLVVVTAVVSVVMVVLVVVRLSSGDSSEGVEEGGILPWDGRCSAENCKSIIPMEDQPNGLVEVFSLNIFRIA